MVEQNEQIVELAENLEEHASSRANFSNLSESERTRVARHLHLARVQANASNAPENMLDGGAYTDEFIRKKNRYFYACGDVGISASEARTIWWNVVYESAAPSERGDLI